MTKVIVSFPWESISQLNKSNSWIKKNNRDTVLVFYFTQFHPITPCYFPLQQPQLSPLSLFTLFSYLQPYLSPWDVYERKSSSGVFWWSYTEDRATSLFYDPYYLLFSNPIAFWSGFWRRRDGKMFGCYSKLQTELDVLVFLGSVFSKSLTHMIPAFLAFQRCGTHGSTGALSQILPWNQ